MKYNIEIKNNGALPIPYLERCGEAVMASALYKDKPMFRDALFIGATNNRQILIHCTTLDTIIDPSPDLEIVLKLNSKDDVL